jgi:hypothetical protein
MIKNVGFILFYKYKMIFNLIILILLGITIYTYINKYCVDTSATQCTSNFMTSFMSVIKYVVSIFLKIIYASIDIVKKNPYPKINSS